MCEFLSPIVSESECVKSLTLDDCVKSFEISKICMKQVIRVSLLNMLYNRVECISEAEVVHTTFRNIPHVISYKHAEQKDPWIRKYHEWMKGIFEALDNNLLHEVIFAIKNKATNEIVESYMITVSYNKMNPQLDETSKREALKSDLHKFWIELYNLREPERVNKQDMDIYMAVTLNHAQAPTYSPSGFKRLVAHKKCIFVESPNNKFWKIDTGFHTFHFQIQKIPVAE